MDAVFRFFFKYPLLVFEQGDFVLGRLAAGVVAVLALAALARAPRSSPTGRIVSEGTRARDKGVLIALRLALVAVLFFCLIRPTLVLKAAVPQQNFLGVLLDDSRSMLIADRDGQPRSQFVQRQLTGPQAPLLNELSKRFVLRFFKFSSSRRTAASSPGRGDDTTTAHRRSSATRSSAPATSSPACRSPAW